MRMGWMLFPGKRPGFWLLSKDSCFWHEILIRWNTFTDLKSVKVWALQVLSTPSNKMAEDFQKFSLIFHVWFQKWDLCSVIPTTYQFLITLSWIGQMPMKKSGIGYLCLDIFSTQYPNLQAKFENIIFHFSSILLCSEKWRKMFWTHKKDCQISWNKKWKQN